MRRGLSQYPPEKEEGKTEYKLKLTRVSEERLEHLASQMKYRLSEGGGEAFYVLGVSDEGEPLGLTDEELEVSLENLRRVAARLGARIKVVREKRGRRGKVVEVLVRLSREDSPPIHVSITVLGNVDAGKSTLVGVLCTGRLDDGNGAAMARIARFLHEVESGRTSSVSTRFLGFDVEGRVVNYEIVHPLDESEIYLNSAKIIAFTDLGGHERYLRTTLRGVMSRLPDYAMLVVGANAGLLKMGREHLGICVALGIPVFAVVTKIDMVADEVLKRTIEELRYVATIPGVSKLPFEVRRLDDAVVAARHMQSGRVLPIFRVSSVTGEGLELLRVFLNLLPPRTRWREKLGKPLLMYVDDIFNVRGVGPVVAGLVMRGVVEVDDEVLLGPFKDGSWRPVRVKSIHVNRLPVEKGLAGQEVTLALTNVRYDEIEKGMAVLDRKERPASVRVFEARVTILKHPTTIKPGYQAVLHYGAIRSTVEFVDMEKKPMRTGDRGLVVLRFSYHPWYLEEGSVFVLREARTRAIGRVIRIVE
ncbi:MAG: GTP-binding protein [Thermoprotei archaeon]|nr:MAG: GTP-binding protein [Thermoprotei archaeon]